MSHACTKPFTQVQGFKANCTQKLQQLFHTSLQTMHQPMKLWFCVQQPQPRIARRPNVSPNPLSTAAAAADVIKSRRDRTESDGGELLKMARTSGQTNESGDDGRNRNRTTYLPRGKASDALKKKRPFSLEHPAFR